MSDFFAADQAWMVRIGGFEDYHPTDLTLDDGPLSLRAVVSLAPGTRHRR